MSLTLKQIQESLWKSYRDFRLNRSIPRDNQLIVAELMDKLADDLIRTDRMVGKHNKTEEQSEEEQIKKQQEEAEDLEWERKWMLARSIKANNPLRYER